MFLCVKVVIDSKLRFDKKEAGDYAHHLFE